MTSRHADGHRIHMFPWVSNSFSRQQANPATQNVNRTFPLEATGDAWLLAKRSHSFSNFQRLIFSGMFGCGTKAPCQCRISVKSSVVPWFTKELQIGIGEWMSTSCGIVESYIYIYVLHRYFFWNCFTKDVDRLTRVLVLRTFFAWPVFVDQWHPDHSRWAVAPLHPCGAMIRSRSMTDFCEAIWELSWSIMRIHYENPLWESHAIPIREYKDV